MSTYKITIDINLQTLANAQNIELGLSSLIKFQEYEDKINQQMAGNQISARLKIQVDKNLFKVKVAVWKIMLQLWQIQCEFRGINKSRKDSLQFQFRSIQIKKTLQMKLSKEESNLNFQKLNTELKSIYKHYNTSICEYIGKIILDEQFTRFLQNLPKLFQSYSKRNQETISYYKLQVEDLIKIEYHSQYQRIKELFGLKLNYTIYYDQSQEQTVLLKRFNKSWLTTLNQAQKPVKKGQKQIKLLESVIVHEKQKNLNVLIVDNEPIYVEKLDKSFFSENEDFLNKSALLNVSQINYDKTDRSVIDKEEIKSFVNQVDQTSRNLGVSLNENKSEFDMFSRASSGQQEEFNIPIDELFSRKRSQHFDAISDKNIDSKSQISIISTRRKIDLKNPQIKQQIEQKLTQLEKMIWKKQTHFKYSVVYQMKLLDELNRSQEKLRKEFQSRFSTIEHFQQDLTTQQSGFDNDSQTQHNHFTSINQTDRSMRPPKHKIRYDTANKKDIQQQQRIRSFSPEEENKNQFSRIEYSPIILDDTEQSDNEGLSSMIDSNFNFKGRDTLGAKDGLDTSRFAQNIQGQEVKNIETELDITYRSNLSSMSYFIDPQEHIKTLKSPLITPKKKKNIPQIEQLNFNLQNVKIERSPVHFQDPNKYDYANNSTILQKVHLLGGESMRQKSIRVVNEDGRVSPKMFKFMLLKPQKAFGAQSFKIPTIGNPLQQNQQWQIKLLKFNSKNQ
eukprot:403337392